MTETDAADFRAMVVDHQNELFHARITRLYAERSAGECFLVRHADHCRLREGRHADVCYVMESFWWHNPYAIVLRGRPWSVWMPECQTAPWGVYRAVAAHLSADIGTHIASGIACASLWGPHASAEWRRAVDGVQATVTPVLLGGSQRDLPYYLVRDVARAWASAFPRLRCACGRRMPRWRRSAALRCEGCRPVVPPTPSPWRTMTAVEMAQVEACRDYQRRLEEWQQEKAAWRAARKDYESARKFVREHWNGHR